MAFEPVNELEKLLIAASADPAARPAFTQALLTNELFAITEGTGNQGQRIAQEGESLSLRGFEYQGKLHTAIFTSLQRLQAALQEEAGYVAINGRDLLNVVRGSYLFLNPGSDYGKIFVPEEIDFLLDGGAKQIDAGGQQVLLAQPSVYPQKLVDGLSAFFATQPAVSAAYLAWAVFASNPEGEIMIGVETDGDWDGLVRDVGVIVHEAAVGGPPVDLVRLTGRTDDAINEYMLKRTTPFYTRRKKILGLF